MSKKRENISPEEALLRAIFGEEVYSEDDYERQRRKRKRVAKEKKDQ